MHLYGSSHDAAAMSSEASATASFAPSHASSSITPRVSNVTGLVASQEQQQQHEQLQTRTTANREDDELSSCCSVDSDAAAAHRALISQSEQLLRSLAGEDRDDGEDDAARVLPSRVKAHPMNQKNKGGVLGSLRSFTKMLSTSSKMSQSDRPAVPQMVRTKEEEDRGRSRGRTRSIMRSLSRSRSRSAKKRSGSSDSRGSLKGLFRRGNKKKANGKRGRKKKFIQIPQEEEEEEKDYANVWCAAPEQQQDNENSEEQKEEVQELEEETFDHDGPYDEANVDISQRRIDNVAEMIGSPENPVHVRSKRPQSLPVFVSPESHPSHQSIMVSHSLQVEMSPLSPPPSKGAAAAVSTRSPIRSHEEKMRLPSSSDAEHFKSSPKSVMDEITFLSPIKKLSPSEQIPKASNSSSSTRSRRRELDQTNHTRSSRKASSSNRVLEQRSGNFGDGSERKLSPTKAAPPCSAEEFEDEFVEGISFGSHVRLARQLAQKPQSHTSHQPASLRSMRSASSEYSPMSSKVKRTCGRHAKLRQKPKFGKSLQPSVNESILYRKNKPMGMRSRSRSRTPKGRRTEGPRRSSSVRSVQTKSSGHSSSNNSDHNNSSVRFWINENYDECRRRRSISCDRRRHLEEDESMGYSERGDSFASISLTTTSTLRKSGERERGRRTCRREEERPVREEGRRREDERDDRRRSRRKRKEDKEPTHYRSDSRRHEEESPRRRVSSTKRRGHQSRSPSKNRRDDRQARGKDRRRRRDRVPIKSVSVERTSAESPSTVTMSHDILVVDESKFPDPPIALPKDEEEKKEDESSSSASAASPSFSQLSTKAPSPSPELEDVEVDASAIALGASEEHEFTIDLLLDEDETDESSRDDGLASFSAEYEPHQVPATAPSNLASLQVVTPDRIALGIRDDGGDENSTDDEDGDELKVGHPHLDTSQNGSFPTFSALEQHSLHSLGSQAIQEDAGSSCSSSSTVSSWSSFAMPFEDDSDSEGDGEGDGYLEQSHSDSPKRLLEGISDELLRSLHQVTGGVPVAASMEEPDNAELLAESKDVLSPLKLVCRWTPSLPLAPMEQPKRGTGSVQDVHQKSETPLEQSVKTSVPTFPLEPMNNTASLTSSSSVESSSSESSTIDDDLLFKPEESTSVTADSSRGEDDDEFRRLCIRKLGAEAASV